MPIPLYIDWKVDPELISDPLTIRWYGVLFAIAFLLGHKILSRIFRNEGVSEKQLDQVLIYVMIGTIVGARLGHVFFYDWGYYSEHLGEIPKIWKGGLASHGGAVGIILALWAFSRWVSGRHLLWILDRVAPPIALGGMFIRLGNLMNHEIIGAPSDLPWAFRFCDPLQYRIMEKGVSYSQWCATHVPRHPSQIYEALAYLAIFGVLFYMYWRNRAYRRQGLLIGSFLVLVFTARFFIEFVKAYQTEFLQGWPLTMGQLLSIPFVLIGVVLLIRAFQRSPEEDEREVQETS